MKLFQQFHGKSMALRTLLFSTQAPTRQPSVITPLERMIMQVRDPTASVVPILDNWVQQGNQIKHSQLQKLTTDLHPIRFNHALQMLQWMGGKGGYELSAADFAAQLELTSRVHGIKQAETYFDAIPNNLRGYEVYCALLRSYAHHRCLKKGEATMQKLRELGFVRDVSAYNVMLEFYSKIRSPPENDKMNILTEEMREKGINYNRITYNILLKFFTRNYYCSYTVIPRMEKLLAKLEADPLVKIDWYHYLLAAEIYWIENRDDPHNTLTMLKKSEESMEEGDLSRFGFELLTLYAAVGNKADVHRLWSLYKLHKGFCNKAYLCMIDSLIDLDDMDGAEGIWEEWFSKKKEMDFGIPQAMIDAYRKKCQLEKAEPIVFRMAESGIEPDADTLYSLAHAYFEGEQMDKAVEASMKALSVSEPGWEPELYVIGRCFDYLERQGDDVAKEELYKMLKERCCTAPEWACHGMKTCESDSGEIVTCYMREWE